MSPEVPSNLNERLEAAKPELVALKVEEVMSPRVPRERALDLTKELKANFAAQLPQLEKLYNPEYANTLQAYFDSLENRVYVFFAADLHLETPYTPEQQKRRKALMKLVHDHDKFLFKWAWILFEEDADLKEILEDIRSKRGAMDDAEDVTRLTVLLEKKWETVEASTKVITKERLKSSNDEALELITLLKLASSEDPGSPRDIQKRAYTYWAEAYNSLRDAGLQLLRKDPSRKTLFPGINAERSSTSPKTNVPTQPPKTEPAVVVRDMRVK